ncbi:MAG: hypothetical protein GY906_18695 [bacterium]|nr:hypothetical protein [bacterium]
MGSITFEYDEARNIVFTVDEWEINTAEDVDEFFGRCEEFFESVGKKFYMISQIDGLRVYGEISDCYAERARTVFDTYMLGFARWGTNTWGRMTVRTTSAKANILANIYDTREEAVKALERLGDA